MVCATLRGMRGGIARWKRGVASQGIKQAVAYAFQGSCDASLSGMTAEGIERAATYGDETMTRFTVEDGQVSVDQVDKAGLRAWIGGADPVTGDLRGREVPSPNADLLLDATVNASKTFSVAAMLDPDLAAAYEQLEDRIRDRAIRMWQFELNSRRGHAGAIRMDLSRIEVVELKHERSRSLDPHKHRHLWLNIKVQGRDGRWSNIDSRVAMQFQTVINGEGDLAARTDPEWVAALAAKGYTLTAEGEIAELQHLVRPLSRRSNQIEANRAARLAEWREQNPGREPDKGVLDMIDRWAWAHGRPNKPGHVDEAVWADTVRGEIAAIDPAALQPRKPVAAATVTADSTGQTASVATVDRDELAAAAIADADTRSYGRGGRFSRFDIEGGVRRAVATAGIVADRAVLDELVQDVAARALTGAGVISLLDDTEQPTMPGHVKQLMATYTAAAKTDLGTALDTLHGPGQALDDRTLATAAAKELDKGKSLDAGQADAAAAVAGTDRLVAVIGPAGAGKTTLLKVARRALEDQGRRMVVVAPTKKAASVVGREIGTTASSLHRLLMDYGFQWKTDTRTGRTVWSRRPEKPWKPGVTDALEYGRSFPLSVGDRIVVDEASMVDLDAARALAIVARETGAGIAMVGDQYQAMPVGHAGAMAMLAQRATATVELSTVHRFRDADDPSKPNTAYADLTLRLRTATADTAAGIADELVAGGHVSLAANEQGVRDRMVEKYFEVTGRRKTIALVTGTNETAQAVNEAIQAERIRRGQITVTPGRTGFGQHEQAVHVGDVVQTRKNDRDLQVENRALWTIAKIHRDGSLTLRAAGDSGDVRKIDAEYAATHLHLAYASTVHGIQGETTDEAYTGPGVDAAGLYVGNTRGKFHNESIHIAGTLDDAKAQLIDTITRGVPETTIADGRAAAQAELDTAARTAGEPDVPAPWQDRPWGHVADVDDRLQSERAVQHDARTALEHVVDRIAQRERTLVKIDQRLADLEARDNANRHAGRPVEPAERGKLADARDRLAKGLEQDRAEQVKLSKSYRKVMARIDDGVTEQRLRNGQPDPVRRTEANGRAARRARADDVSAPAVWRPTDDAGPTLG